MKSKKLFVALATLAACATLASCGEKKDASAVEKAIADAETLTQDELFAKAAEELGTKGQVKILATTSRGGKDKVKNLFIEMLQKHNKDITDPLVYDTTVDGAIYTTLLSEIQSGTTNGYSGTITQDGYQLQTKGLDTGYFKNYIPKEWKEAEGVDVKEAGNPFTLQYNFKTWMYNNKNGDMNIDNVWDVTDSSFKGKIDTMDPTNENVNMDWLIQLTSDENEAALKSAYEAENRNSDVTIDTTVSKPYSTAFIKAFINNAVFYEDDGKAINNLASTPGNIGWIVYSKLLKVNESEEISKKNIVVAALGTENTDGATMGDSKLTGFSGFMYKHYLQVMPNAQYPYATCAFFNLISTSKEAYSVWGGDVGDYPSLPSINQDRTKNGYVEGVSTFPCLNDPTSDWWLGKGAAVVETPSFIGPNYESVVEGIIDPAIAAKAK